MSPPEVTRELQSSARAAARATSLLRTSMWRTEEHLAAVVTGDCSSRRLASLLRLRSDALVHASRPVSLSAVDFADRREGLVRWCEAYGVSGGWDVASPFVRAGLGDAFLSEVVAQVGEGSVSDAVCWLSHAVDTQLLLREIEQATGRISTLVADLGRSP